MHLHILSITLFVNAHFNVLSVFHASLILMVLHRVHWMQTSIQKAYGPDKTQELLSAENRIVNGNFTTAQIWGNLVVTTRTVAQAKVEITLLILHII